MNPTYRLDAREAIMMNWHQLSSGKNDELTPDLGAPRDTWHREMPFVLRRLSVTRASRRLRTNAQGLPDACRQTPYQIAKHNGTPDALKILGLTNTEPSRCKPCQETGIMRLSHRGTRPGSQHTMATDFRKKEAVEILKAEELQRHTARCGIFTISSRSCITTYTSCSTSSSFLLIYSQGPRRLLLDWSQTTSFRWPSFKSPSLQRTPAATLAR